MISFDSNLLVYAFALRSPEHARARRAIEHAVATGRHIGVPLTCIGEFWSAVTHPNAIGGPATGREAEQFLNSLMLQANAAVWVPGTSFWQTWTNAAMTLNVVGPRIFDLQIALIALENGATEIWTHDRNFIALPGLRVHDPL